MIEENKEEYSVFKDKVIIWTVAVVIIMAALIRTICHSTLTANAKEESYTVSFSSCYEVHYKGNVQYFRRYADFTVESGYTIYGVCGLYDEYRMSFYLVDDETGLFMRFSTLSDLQNERTKFLSHVSDMHMIVDDLNSDGSTYRYYEQESIPVNEIVRGNEGVTDGYGDGDSLNKNVAVSSNFPIFINEDALTAYLSTGDDSGQIYKPYDNLSDTIPSFEGFPGFTFDATDSSYLSDFKLENFNADYAVNASWSGVHIPTKLNDWVTNGTVSMDDIGVCVMFTYSNKTYADDTYIKYLPTLINVNDLSAFIDVSQYQPADSNYYLAKLSFIPLVEFTYYNSGMGTSMTPLNLMYYGSMSHVYFNNDGSAGGSDFNSGDINGNTGGGFAAGDDDYDGIAGITGDITDSMDAVGDVLDGVSNGIKGFVNFVTLCFGFLPWWSTAILGVGVSACVVIGIVKTLRG